MESNWIEMNGAGGGGGNKRSNENDRTNWMMTNELCFFGNIGATAIIIIIIN